MATPQQSTSIHRGKILGPLGLALVLAIAGLFHSHASSASFQLPAPTETARSMTAAPNFTLPNQDGKPVRLSEYRGKKVVLTFYRGYW